MAEYWFCNSDEIYSRSTMCDRWEFALSFTFDFIFRLFLYFHLTNIARLSKQSQKKAFEIWKEFHVHFTVNFSLFENKIKFFRKNLKETNLNQYLPFQYRQKIKIFIAWHFFQKLSSMERFEDNLNQSRDEIFKKNINFSQIQHDITNHLMSYHFWHSQKISNSLREVRTSKFYSSLVIKIQSFLKNSKLFHHHQQTFCYLSSNIWWKSSNRTFSFQIFHSLSDEPGDDQPFVANNDGKPKVNTNLYLYSVWANSFTQ